MLLGLAVNLFLFTVPDFYFLKKRSLFLFLSVSAFADGNSDFYLRLLLNSISSFSSVQKRAPESEWVAARDDFTAES